ncbi:unnamed protein product [Leptidea sinapis]|uniref:Uncharacterized protein n=1 Tax=Leptidea sinapis TaxID=189913 RepID=A0A5E4QGY0_9NEOP|nr:unnamed protein product [Leptidea sinapis]
MSIAVRWGFKYASSAPLAKGIAPPWRALQSRLGRLLLSYRLQNEPKMPPKKNLRKLATSPHERKVTCMKAKRSPKVSQINTSNQDNVCDIINLKAF